VSDGGRCLDPARRRVVEEFGDIVLVARGGFQHGANDGVNVVAAALAICRRAAPDMVGRSIDRLCALGYDVREIGQGERISADRHRGAIYPARRRRTGAAGRGINPADRVDRHACRLRQGEAVRLRHALTLAPNVRYWENSGKHLLAASISPFDPQPDIPHWDSLPSPVLDLLPNQSDDARPSIARKRCGGRRVHQFVALSFQFSDQSP
jgi:hypothetical protein